MRPRESSTKGEKKKRVAVLTFARDEEKGELLCEALKEEYRPSPVSYRGREDMEGCLQSFDMVVAVMAVGIVVRTLCPHLRNKWTDAPVVAVDSSLRCAVPVVGGHHGANDLALYLAEKLGLYPAVTTATDSAERPNLERVAKGLGSEIVNRDSSRDINLAFLKEDVPVLRLKGPKIVVVDGDVAVLRRKGLVVGLGARRGVTSAEVLEAVTSALESVGRELEEIGVLATSDIKRGEPGMEEAALALGIDLIYLSEEVLNSQTPTTPSRAEDLGLRGVAEPAVLALSQRLIMAKKAYGRVTVALGE